MKLISNLYQLPATIIFIIIGLFIMAFAGKENFLIWLTKTSEENYQKYQIKTANQKIIYNILFHSAMITPWLLIIKLIF